MAEARVRERSAGAASAITGAVVLGLGGHASLALWSATSEVSGAARTLATVLLAVAGLQLLRAVRTRAFSLALACFWAWSFVFLGLAPAYQLAAGVFPWLGRFEDAVVVRAQVVVLVGHTAVLIGTRLAGRRPARAAARRARVAVVPQRTSSSAAHHRRVTTVDRRSLVMRRLVLAQVLVSVTFAGLMGPSALLSGRVAFREQLLFVSTLPGGGTLYFLATASAIVVPAMAVAGRRLGLGIPGLLLLVSVAAGLVVTNPFIGSRFLTGSFLVAVAGAQLMGRSAARLLPVGTVLLLVTVFPSLDVLRGDGTGSDRVSALTPSEALRTFDFDAFEMLLRAVVVDQVPGQVVDPVMALAAPLLRWVPFVADSVVGGASGPLVARATGMTYTNVSMPLWGEGYLVAGLAGTALVLGLLGAWLGINRRSVGVRDRLGAGLSVADAPSAALLFIVLRGSLYEVLGYLLFAVTMWVVLWRRGVVGGAGEAQDAVEDLVPERGPSGVRQAVPLVMAATVVGADRDATD
jgi:hypothetical protein